MEFNGESNQIEGTKKYNFYMNGDGKDKKKVDIKLPNKDIVDLSGAKLKSDKIANGVKSDEEYLKEIQDVEDYNKALLTPSDEIKNFKFNGNVVIVRLFKHCPVKEVSGMFIPNELVLPYQDKESGRIKTMANPLQFEYRGVINHVSDQCSEGFRNKFKVGDVVDLKMGLNLMQQRTWLTTESYYEDKFENWFSINENMIEKGICS